MTTSPEIEKFEDLHALAKDVCFPIISTGMILYSNSKGHPFEVQYVAGWITTSVFHESNQRFLKFCLSCVLCLTYVEEFASSLGALNRMFRAHIADGSMQIMPHLTWMQTLNICGPLYLGMMWLYSMMVQCKPEALRYRRQVSTISGISYIVVTLALYRKFKRSIW